MPEVRRGRGRPAAPPVACIRLPSLVPVPFFLPRSRSVLPFCRPTKMKLAVDENLGKLALWLRALGLDVVYIRPGTSPARKRLISQGRLFLTKTRRRPLAGALVIDSDDPGQQLKEAALKLSIDPERLTPFSRCLRCNTLLQTLSREEAAASVPEYVLATQRIFKLCPRCGRVFWPGTHQARMAGRLEALKREIS